MNVGNTYDGYLKPLSVNKVIKRDRILAPSAPTVTSPIYLCKGSTTNVLTANASAGATLIWYGTDATGGLGNPIAPTPSTTTAGQTKYYVSQSDSSGESPRSEIVVNVVADTNDTIQFINCTYPSPNSIYFDWANIVNHPSNAYNYSYSIGGGPLFSGNVNNSSVTITAVMPGQSVTVTVTSVVGFPCIPQASKTCSIGCGTSTMTPDFNSVPRSYCLGQAITDLPTSSEDSPQITGAWSPVKVNTATAGTTDYVFTPDPVAFPCALTKTLSATVGAVEPNFALIPTSYCVNYPTTGLSNSSDDSPLIMGTWFPARVNTATAGTSDYIFTPNSGQACAPNNKIITVTVNPLNTITSIGWTVTEAFATNQIVSVTDPVGPDYLYQLDDGALQASPVFERVSLGMHSIAVKDVNGCSEFSDNNVLVIDYPRFFTPNNDGFNDFWNVFTLTSKLGSKIQIFDRYGKLLKEISPNSSGLNGTYNGQPLPATDYWFVVDYPEGGVIKKFRSHFSLKR